MLLSRVSKLLTSGRRDRRTKRPARVGVESMEGRQLMTGAILHPIPVFQANLNVVSLNVQNLANNEVQLTATLANGPTNPLPIQRAQGTAYPGGNVFEITRSTGGTFLYGPPSALTSSFGLVVPDSGQVIASMPIPSIPYGSTIQLSTVTTGRAIFTAAAVPAQTVTIGQAGFTAAAVPVHSALPRLPLPLPVINTANASLTVDDLIPTTLTVDTATMNLIPKIQSAVANGQVVLNGSNSSIMMPGLLNDQFSIPGQPYSFWPISTVYNVNNLRSTSLALGYANGGLQITMNFANNTHALHTSSILPDIGVKNLSITVDLPLSYNSEYQYFVFGQPQVQVNGNWSINGPLSILNGLLPNIDQKMESAFTQAITPQLDQLSYQFTSQIHTLTTGGRIVNATIQPTQMILQVETPAPLF